MSKVPALNMCKSYGNIKNGHFIVSNLKPRIGTSCGNLKSLRWAGMAFKYHLLVSYLIGLICPLMQIYFALPRVEFVYTTVMQR